MSDCCFSGHQNQKKPVPKMEHGELKYEPVADKILTAKEYRAKLERNRRK